MTSAKRGVRGNPMLSRDKIVDKALDLLGKIPLEDFTVRKLATALRITPGAMYRYFSSQEELLDAVYSQVLEGVDLSRLDDGLDWQGVLKCWAHAYRAQMLRHPNTAQISRADTQVSSMWFEITEPIITALSAAGFSDVGLMNTVRFFYRTVAGAVIMELVHDTISAPNERKQVDKAMHAISPKAQSAWATVYAFLGSQNNDELFEFTVEQLINGIEATRPVSSKKRSMQASPCVDG